MRQEFISSGDLHIESYHYGVASLWVLSGSLTGTRAGRLTDRLTGYFFEEGRSLLVDLRRVHMIDTPGADALERACLRYPDLSLVGRPANYHSCPLSIRETVDLLRPADSIETAFSSVKVPGKPSARRVKNTRAHQRIPVQIPVEIFCGGIAAAAVLNDLSMGGSRIARIPYSWLSTLDTDGEAPEISIAGMGLDPFGQEIVEKNNQETIVSAPVHKLTGGSSLGVQFFTDISLADPETV